MGKYSGAHSLRSTYVIVWSGTPIARLFICCKGHIVPPAVTRPTVLAVSRMLKESAVLQFEKSENKPVVIGYSVAAVIAFLIAEK